MSKTLSDYISQIRFFIEEDGLSVEQAIDRVKVPVEYIDKIKADIERLVNFKPEKTAIISDSSNLDFINPDIFFESDVFGNFLKHIYDNLKWDQDVCVSIKTSTEQIILNVPDPNQLMDFSNLGLVVGYVQSGKTANMAGLIARCIDAGYKIIIVLAGVLNNLRAQTQQRFDRDIIGYGVSGTCINHPVDIIRFTSENLNGDFKDSPLWLNSTNPNFFVIKKHPLVIEKLKSWLMNKMKNHDLSRTPCIIIDDEADQASINTNYDKYDDGNKVDPSRTNKKIRELLNLFPKCVYIGYTATPFANILIDAEEEDLYPKDFIAILPEPLGYMGARKIFGLGLTPSILSDEPNEDSDYDVIRYIDESDLNMLENLPGNSECPSSLTNAIISFILSSACRYLRGHENHHYSMLVHISHKVLNHKMISDIIENEVKFLKNVFKDRSGTYPEITRKIREIWEFDFIQTSKNISDQIYINSFEQILEASLMFIDEIEVLTLHYNSRDNLDFTQKPRRYIVIGGNKLSRGLTIEGLSVSYFTRTSRTYDTLLQMGRWFGFRNQYDDLTRLYVSEENFNNFKDLARVELELREDLKKYADRKNKVSPKDIFPVIRCHPALAVTSQNKMGAGKIQNISYSGSTSETVNFFFNDKEKLKNNQIAITNFLIKAGAPSRCKDGFYYWMDIPSDRILEFLLIYNFSPDSRTVNNTMLTKYILKQNKHSELIKWDIVIPKGNQKTDVYHWSENITTNKIKRSRYTNTSIKVLRNPEDLIVWKNELGRDEDCVMRGTMFFYVIDQLSYKDNIKKKLFRAGESAEDIVGIVFKFPFSNTHETVEYISQEKSDASI